ncbi:MAG TPA: metalloregulator ArsR/SmtB family transcription factor [Spirochaetota bacterium]|nr:metalloregulator ArsR/SmtB family transcription factor [Spirochaetota bacterium]HPJ33704.1 metalloregulator ArsR/SmtB family transcription factor [Spirochaetota bacterium]
MKKKNEQDFYTEMDDPEFFKIHAEFCSVLSNEKRLRIMWLLQGGEHSVSDIAETLGISMTNVSQHLKVLKNQGAVAERKEGKLVYYRITNRKFIEGCRLIRQGIIENFRQRSDVLLKK